MDFLRCEAEYRGGATVVALGMFDGVHIGHQKLLRVTVEKARACGAVSVAITFDRHPLSLLRPECVPAELTDVQTKRKIIEKIGIQTLIVRPFSREFADLPARQYIEYLIKTLKPVAIAAGYNYTFGCGGQGDAALLTAMGNEYGYEAIIVAPVLFEGVPVSSTMIREALNSGNIEKANALLGRRDMCAIR